MILALTKTKTLEVVETSGVFYSIYVRWLMPLGFYCLSFLSSHLQIQQLATPATTETKNVMINSSINFTSFLLEVRQQPYNITVFCCFLPLFDKIFTQKEQDRSRSLPFLIRRHSVNLLPALYNLQLQTLLLLRNHLS